MSPASAVISFVVYHVSCVQFSRIVLLFFSTGREERKKGRKEGRRKEGLESLSLFLVPLTGLVCVGRVGGCRCPYQGHVSIPRNNEDFNAVAREDVPGMRSA